MNRLVSRRLNMAVRVRDFCDTNPSTDPSIVNRQQVRRRLRDDLLRHLVTIARDASAEQPGLGDKFEIPASNLSSARFFAASKAMLELGSQGKEVLVKHGLSDKLLDDLAT